MIKTIIVDDEQLSLELIIDLAKQTGFLEVVKAYTNPGKVLEEIRLVSPQVAFIDILLPNICGITLAEKLLERVPTIKIVFITAWNQFAVKAFELNALDYIMKPINTERFNKMAERLKNDILSSRSETEHKLKIKCFDHLVVSIDGEPVKWQRTKAAELFAFLLTNHNEYIYKDVILEELWPDIIPAKALPILQTSVCKIRSIFSDFPNEIKLDYSGGKYCLILNCDDCDFIKFVNSINNYYIGDKNTYSEVEKAYLIYKEGLLTYDGYLWSIEKNRSLKNFLIKAIKEIKEVYYSEHNDLEYTKFDEMLNKFKKTG